MATVDASIYGAIRTPSEITANRLRIENAGMQNKLAQLALDEKNREISSQNALADAYRNATNPDGSIDRNRLITSLATGGQGARIPGIQKTFADQDKAMRDAERARLEQARERVNLIGQVAGSATDPQSYAAGRAALAQAGIDVSNIPEQYDPAYVASARNQALTANQQIEQIWKQKGYDLDVAKFGYQQRNDAANRGVTIRGQNMADARAREANQAGKAPPGYRWSADGSSLEVIPGGPADGKGGGKPLTEGQSKAALFGARMAASDKIIQDLASQGVNNSVPGSNLPFIGGVVTALSPAKRQQLDQAKRDFINATLRRESGAVISPEEFANGEKQYFAQPGDSAAVIAQKARNRAIATRGVLAEVPESRRDDMVREIIGDQGAGKVVDFGSLK